MHFHRNFFVGSSSRPKIKANRPANKMTLNIVHLLWCCGVMIGDENFTKTPMAISPICGVGWVGDFCMSSVRSIERPPLSCEK